MRNISEKKLLSVAIFAALLSCHEILFKIGTRPTETAQFFVTRLERFSVILFYINLPYTWPRTSPHSFDLFKPKKIDFDPS